MVFALLETALIVTLLLLVWVSAHLLHRRVFGPQKREGCGGCRGRAGCDPSKSCSPSSGDDGREGNSSTPTRQSREH